MKIAVVGTGMIAREALNALRMVRGVEIPVLCARAHSREKAEHMAQEFNIPHVVTDYAELLTSHAADFVYLGIVNSAHFDYARQAISAGWNVIVEKPFASTLAETEELIARARAAQSYVFDDRYLARDVAPAFDPVCSGGALYDLNVYNLALIIALFGRPLSASYLANIGFNGIDTSGVMTLRYDGFCASSAAAKDSSSPSFLMIQGENGWIRTDGTPNELRSFTIGLRGAEPETFALNRHEHRMVHEFEEMQRIYRQRDYTAVEDGFAVTRAVMAVMEKARLMAGIQFRAD